MVVKENCFHFFQEYENQPELGYCIRIYEDQDFMKIDKCYPFYEEKFFLKNKLEVAYLRWGDFDAEMKVIAVHGYLDNAATFQFLGDYFLKSFDSVCIIALDLLGYGKSDHKSIDGSYRFVDHAYEVYEILVHNLKWEKCHYLVTTIIQNLLD